MIRRALQVFALVLMAGVSNAQISTATLSGVLTDPSNAIVGGADVTVTHLDTNRPFKTTTDSNGRYSLTALPVGRYKISIGSAGFKTLEREFELSVNQAANLNLVMEIGQITEVVDVSAKAPLVNATK
jgi:hypothetical protein